MTNYGRGGYIFVAGDIANAQARLEANSAFMQQATRFDWLEKELLGKMPGLRVADDDWPYIYLESAAIPVLYFLLAALMLALIAYCHARFGIAREITSFSKSQWHFFFMGAAFLLLEVQNISKASVVLGSTWWVNAIIISAILLMILLSNLIAASFPRINLKAVFAALIGTCIALYFLDLSIFAGLTYPVRAAVVAVITTLPMLFSGIIFIRSFAAVDLKNAALGSNLFGAIVGGLAQSLTFATGVRFLLIVVALLYTAALLTRPSEADV
jgi:hypothetical protein